MIARSPILSARMLTLRPVQLDYVDRVKLEYQGRPFVILTPL